MVDLFDKTLLVHSIWIQRAYDTSDTEALAFHKKRRRVVKSFLSKLGTKLTDLEADTTIPTLLESSRNLAAKLKTLQQEFKEHQLAIINRTDAEDILAEEQQSLDDNEDHISELSVRIQRLMALATASTGLDVAKVATRQLALLRTKLESIDEAVRNVDNAEENATCTLEEYRDQVIVVKTELATLNASLLSSDVATDGPIMPSCKTILERTRQPLTVCSRLKNDFLC